MMVGVVEMEKGNEWWRVRVARWRGEDLDGDGFRLRFSAASIGAQRCCSEHGVALRVIESNLSLE